MPDKITTVEGTLEVFFIKIAFCFCRSLNKKSHNGHLFSSKNVYNNKHLVKLRV